MKTKLLFLAFILSFTSNYGQIGIFEGFESGIPNTWSNLGASIQNLNGQAHTGAQYVQMIMSLGSNTSLSTTNYTSDGTAITLSVKYKKFEGAFGNLGLRYYANNSGTPIDISSVGLFSNASSGFQYQTLTGNIAAGNIPSGMSVRFELYVWGSGGSNTAIFFDDFTAYQENGLFKPAITVNPVTIGVNSASINYGLQANSLNATSVVRYGTLSSDLSSSATGFTAIGTNVISSNVNLTGLLTSTLYYYQIEATNSKGTETSIIGSFTTASITPQLITEYNFNNTYNNVNGNTPFASNAGTTFVMGRDGVTTNGALNINNTGTTATILGLPYNQSARTISIWAKVNVYNGFNHMFSYGASQGGGAQGGNFTRDQVNYFGYFTNIFHNLPVADYNNLSTWYHFVYVYDGTIAKIYKNGTLIKTQTINWNTINNNNIFKLGTGVGNELTFNGAIDDLKIYNYALSQAEVTSLFSNNTLSSQSYSQNNLKVSLYPNPAKDILTIETTANIKMIEIYNIEGRKVLSSLKKQIHVSSLTSGMYVVKIKDENDAIASRKIIIE